MSMLENKAIIITGAASGIGEEAARDFARAGARLLLADLSEDRGEAVAEAIRETGSDVLFVKTDLSDDAAIQNMVATAVDRFGRLDGAFNNAGVPPRGRSIDDMTIEDWDEVLGINLRSGFLATKYQSRAMRDTGGGALVFTSSVAGILGAPHVAEYATSKHGLIGLMRCASAEYSLTRVRANAVLPGLTRTPMLAHLTCDDGELIPELDGQIERYSVGRTGQAIDVARAAKWLLSGESEMINGVALPVDGGFSARY
jgi:NAD(P)-dependent dehydrogenase (short-subunit alcohol dehydrogenase family)